MFQSCPEYAPKAFRNLSQHGNTVAQLFLCLRGNIKACCGDQEGQNYVSFHFLYAENGGVFCLPISLFPYFKERCKER